MLSKAVLGGEKFEEKDGLMKYYIKHFSGPVSEGGAVRNQAFYRHFEKRSDVKIIDISSTNIFQKIFHTLRFIIYFKLRQNDQIYMHLGAIFVLFPAFLFRNGLSRPIFKFLDQMSKHHILQIEVNDLPFEQSKDLELPDSSFYQLFQDRLFDLKNVKYDFASNRMRDYAQKKYHLGPQNCAVLLNGSDSLIEFDPVLYEPILGRETEKLKYVYVGSLNKGRQIEHLIRIFAESTQQLFLLGPGGEWIQEALAHKDVHNISYLGVFDDSTALQISSLCDIGVIPYDDSRLYYNICYPTKVSFYLSAGLPILCTRLEETQSVLAHKNLARFLPIDHWTNFLAANSKEDINLLRKEVLLYRDQFYWSSILSGLNF